MGTYPPRECGIATFNQDLLKSSQRFFGKSIACKVAAMNLSSLETYVYPEEVEWKIDQNNKKEYADLAQRFNADPLIIGIIIQHEYGIYGGVYGANILSFIEKCTKPMVVTLHTVLPNPAESMKHVTARVIDKAQVIVVLTQSSKNILERVYPQSINKVHVIPHGIHPTRFETTASAKKRLKLAPAIVLSTFGLLSRGKGIEYMIQALPNLAKQYPSILYLVLGETHPVVRRDEGENYRNELARLVTKLGLKKHVRFYDQYLSLVDLVEFLKATDVYISTSINPDQTVSGTLSYALGTGRAVISTAFTQAKEIITSDIGRLVPIKDSAALNQALVEVLSNKTKLKQMHRDAYRATRSMLWSRVAHEYSLLLQQNILPPVNLNHLRNMTDEFGLFQFAALDKPNKKFGYTLDDNARAAVICSWKANAWRHTYLNFIKRCQQPDGSFINYIDYRDKKVAAQNSQEDLEDASARAMWAVSEVAANKLISIDDRNLAKEIFKSALPITKEFLHIRSCALLIKAWANLMTIYPEYDQELIDCIKQKADFLVKKFEENSIKAWRWFDTYLGYNNAIVPEALMIAGKVTKTQLYVDAGNEALAFLIKKTFSANRYIPIGQAYWYRNNRSRSNFDQQPEDPAAMILALASAYSITHNETYRNLIPVCFSWFLGNNSLQLPLYNYENGGCYDGLHPDRVNLNQGAESLVSYLLSRLAIEKLYRHENSKNQTYIS